MQLKINELEIEINKLKNKITELENTLTKQKTRSEYVNNRESYKRSLYKLQKGIDILSGKCISNQPKESCIHHIVPIAMGGTNDLTNMVLLNTTTHKLIHSKVSTVKNETFEGKLFRYWYYKECFLDNLNYFREKAGQEVIYTTSLKVGVEPFPNYFENYRSELEKYMQEKEIKEKRRIENMRNIYGKILYAVKHKNIIVPAFPKFKDKMEVCIYAVNKILECEGGKPIHIDEINNNKNFIWKNGQKTKLQKYIQKMFLKIEQEYGLLTKQQMRLFLEGYKLGVFGVIPVLDELQGQERLEFINDFIKGDEMTLYEMQNCYKMERCESHKDKIICNYEKKIFEQTILCMQEVGKY